MRRCLLYFLWALLLCGCQTASHKPEPADDTLMVSAAASLKEAFTEIGNLYQNHTGKIIHFNFGASGALQKQIEAGAPVDVFASAGGKQMDEIAERGFINTVTRSDFARNALALVVPADSKLPLTTFADLASSSVQKIAVGNPRTVPVGQYTEQVFDFFKLRDRLQNRLITAEDVRQVLDYVIRGEVDAGIVYLTDARTAGTRVRVIATAPEASHSAILYPIAVIKDSQHPAAAQAFVDLVIGTEGQAILQKYGFVRANIE